MFQKLFRNRANKQAAINAALSAPDDLRGVGILAEALWIGNRRTRLLAEAALIRLLPRLQASETFLLEEEQRNCLYRALREKNRELQFAVLRALEQIGDETALPHVERLIAKADDKRMREAAIECLRFLRAREEQNVVSRMLLRSSREPMHEETLLRASYPPSVPADALRQTAQAGKESV